MKYSTAIDAAEIKSQLKKAFPHTKFSVKSQVYSMGSSIHINYIDGPTVKEVEAIANKKESIDRDEATGEILSGGNQYVFVNRDFSPEIYAKETSIFMKKWGIPEGTDLNTYRLGYDWGNQALWRHMCQIGSL